MRNIYTSKGRYYVVDPDSNLTYPSVTTILSNTSHNTGLDDWRNRVGIEEANRKSAFSANRGTVMHSLHEHYIQAKFIDKIESKPVTFAYNRMLEECKGMTADEISCGCALFKAALLRSDFYRDITEVIFQEMPIWSDKFKYAGRLDLLLVDSSGKRKLTDFKSSTKPKRMEWLDSYKKQLGAYSVALFERYNIFPDLAELVISCEDGTLQEVQLTKDELKYWFGSFKENVDEYYSNCYDESERLDVQIELIKE